jgi:hypothetical protein
MTSEIGDYHRSSSRRSHPTFPVTQSTAIVRRALLSTSLDVPRMRALVRLNVLEATFRAALGIELLAGSTAMGGSLGRHTGSSVVLDIQLVEPQACSEQPVSHHL